MQIGEDIRQQLLAVWAEMGPDDRRALVALAGEVRADETQKDEIRQLGLDSVADWRGCGDCWLGVGGTD